MSQWIRTFWSTQDKHGHVRIGNAFVAVSVSQPQGFEHGPLHQCHSKYNGNPLT